MIHVGLGRLWCSMVISDVAQTLPMRMQLPQDVDLVAASNKYGRSALGTSYPTARAVAIRHRGDHPSSSLTLTSVRRCYAAPRTTDVVVLASLSTGIYIPFKFNATRWARMKVEIS